jgi:hypothetical protein
MKVGVHSSKKGIHGRLKGIIGDQTVNTSSGLRPANFADPKSTFDVSWDAIPSSLVEAYRCFG